MKSFEHRDYYPDGQEGFRKEEKTGKKRILPKIPDFYEESLVQNESFNEEELTKTTINVVKSTNSAVKPDMKPTNYAMKPSNYAVKPSNSELNSTNCFRRKTTSSSSKPTNYELKPAKSENNLAMRPKVENNSEDLGRRNSANYLWIDMKKDKPKSTTKRDKKGEVLNEYDIKIM